MTMGATTIWERWDSMLPDGSINPGQMTSFNHYALGAVADWMHRVIGGLAPATPGYSGVRIAPQPGGGLSWAKTSLRTPHGEVRVAWEIVDGELKVDAELPEGVAAELTLPGAESRNPRRRPVGKPFHHRRSRESRMTTFASIAEPLSHQAIELPSWAFGNSGTRFKVFGRRGRRGAFGRSWLMRRRCMS